jgi:hypothetical protein
MEESVGISVSNGRWNLLCGSHHGCELGSGRIKSVPCLVWARNLSIAARAELVAGAYCLQLWQLYWQLPDLLNSRSEDIRLGEKRKTSFVPDNDV